VLYAETDCMIHGLMCNTRHALFGDRTSDEGVLIGGFCCKPQRLPGPHLVTQRRERVCDSWLDMDQQKHIRWGTDLLGREQRVLIKGCLIGGF